ncbi:cupin domain-containing protein [Amycolatopsis speibonae]|uniref:Cupin domain-containing protein n=1 Tax=Amycolatopsis speibonae TaxID=1450224 RepID=A0ABV7P118_9PSEU
MAPPSALLDLLRIQFEEAAPVGHGVVRAEKPGPPAGRVDGRGRGADTGRVPLPPAFSVKATTEDTDVRFSLLEVTVAVDIPRHVHHEADECVYVLDGELGIEFDDETHVAAKGTFVLLPHGAPHALRRLSEPPRVLQISSPGGWEHYLEDLFEAGPAVRRTGPGEDQPCRRTAPHHRRHRVGGAAEGISTEFFPAAVGK